MRNSWESDLRITFLQFAHNVSTIRLLHKLLLKTFNYSFWVRYFVTWSINFFKKVKFYLCNSLKCSFLNLVFAMINLVALKMCVKSFLLKLSSKIRYNLLTARILYIFYILGHFWFVNRQFLEDLWSHITWMDEHIIRRRCR